MQKTVLLSAFLILLTLGSHAGISIYDSDSSSASGASGISVTGSVSSISVNAGDIIVLTASTNKKGDVSPLTATQVGGSGVARRLFVAA